MISNIPFRLKAAGVHLLISLSVALMSLALVFLVWHPNPLQKAVGVTSITLLMLGIDMVLGPILTLLVASSPAKKTLKFDLVVIALLQVSAYVYGMYSIAVSRPVYIAFDTGVFEVVQADTVIRSQHENILPQYRANPCLSPQWIAIRPYENVTEQERRMRLEMQEAIAPSMQADLYKPIDDDTWVIIKNKSESLQTLTQAQQQDILRKHPTVDSYAYLKAPIMEYDMIVLIDGQAKSIKGIWSLN